MIYINLYFIASLSVQDNGLMCLIYKLKNKVDIVSIIRRIKLRISTSIKFLNTNLCYTYICIYEFPLFYDKSLNIYHINYNKKNIYKQKYNNFLSRELIFKH